MRGVGTVAERKAGSAVNDWIGELHISRKERAFVLASQGDNYALAFLAAPPAFLTVLMASEPDRITLR
jgi:hypothetical protein